MTPKQKYDERKRLKAERLLRQEQERKSHHEYQQDMDDQFKSLLVSLERIADVMELWADQQI